MASIPTVIDLTYNSIVQSYIKAYTNPNSALIPKMMGLADYYFPLFEETLDAYDLPLEIKYLPIIESAMNPRARSPVGARGLWQFMFGTARSLGLTVDNYVDERMDPVKSTDAACRYLKTLFEEYQDWHLVIAAYNCGPGNVNKAIRRAGGQRNYWDIYYYLPKETRGHVPAFIAAVYAMNYGYDHQLVPIEAHLPLKTDTIWLEEKVHFSQVSEVLGIPLSLIQDLNPKYRRNVIQAGRHANDLRLPEDQIEQFLILQDSILNYRDDVYFSQNNQNRSPSAKQPSQPPPGDDYTAVYYHVKSGDNLGYIAEWYGVGLSRLKDWNGLYKNRIYSGQKLTVYVPKPDAIAMTKIDQMSFEEKQRMIGNNKTAEVEVQPEDPNFVYYTVKSGDNLWDISQKFEGVTDSDIRTLNQMQNSRLKPGQRLKIKRK